MRSRPSKSESFSPTVLLGRKRALAPLKASILAMFVFVFSWATISVTVGNSMLLPVWSPCVCVLMIVVTGLSETDWIASRIGRPQPGSFESTSTTPSSRIIASEFPPPPVRT